MKRRMAFAVLAVAAVAACGRVADLAPAPGNSLPPPAYGEDTRPGSEDLLEPAAQARPNRNEELLRRSERRELDEFDLPPEG